MSNDQRIQAFEALEKAGSVTPVQVEGIRCPLYLRSEDLPLLEGILAGASDEKPRLEFLAPLDPMLWDRKLLETLWDYAYSWEIYTPAEKRKYGYYVLPMLHGDRFVGRIEAAAERKTGTLAVRNVWFEDGVRRTKKLAQAVDGAVARLARLNKCEKIERKD